MNFKEMSNAEIKEYLSGVNKSLSSTDITDEALASAEKGIEEANKEMEARALKAEKQASAQKAASKAFESVDLKVETFAPQTTETTKGEEMTKENYTVKSSEYRSAWLKKMGGNMFAPMSEAEKAAFTIVTSDSTNGYDNLIPTDTANRIIDLTKEKIALFNDLTIYDAVASYTVPVVTAITAGDATVVAEGASNVDGEKETITEITINPTGFAKDSTMSARFQLQSIDAFETWLVEHIVERLIRAINVTVWAKVTAAATTATNVQDVTGDVTDAHIRKALGSIKGSGDIVVYVNRKTLYSQLVGIETTNGDKVFTESAMVDPIVKGVVYGCAVKVDEDLADGVIAFAIPSQIEANMFEQPNVMSEPDIKTRNIVYAGHAMFGAAIKRADAFAIINETPSV